MTKFQIIFIALFILFIIGGITAFALYKGPDAENKLPQVTVWGTLSVKTFNDYLNSLKADQENALDIAYTEVSVDAFDNKFIQALARGEGPDMVLLPAEMTLKHEDKFVSVPYDTLSARSYKDTFIEAAELYLGADGIIGFPFIIDPLVSYWNRDTFRSASIAKPPATWADYDALIPKLTKKDLASNIQKSAIALGEYRNLDNAREILSTLFFQVGNPITVRTTEGVVSTLGQSGKPGLEDSAPAVEFFVNFANPISQDYSWNRSLPSSKAFFLSGKLATYFGFASEIRDIQAKNPNLNFDVIPFPQRATSELKSTYGRLYGFSIVNQSLNTDAAYQVILKLLTPESLAALSDVTYLPPVRRDMLAEGTSDPFMTIFYDSAIISQSWLDPDVASSDSLFQEIIESVTSGRLLPREALRRTQGQLEILLNVN
ncbi:MAG: extracellular solute-binding protein [Patescibacteria group bacterium]